MILQFNHTHDDDDLLYAKKVQLKTAARFGIDLEGETSGDKIETKLQNLRESYVTEKQSV